MNIEYEICTTFHFHLAGPPGTVGGKGQKGTSGSSGQTGTPVSRIMSATLGKNCC